ncbi:hypothetical protein S2091_1255 [Solimicrobium silvestre]|uniref:Uncharacterized protein n=1 Tax=Solimicrobium silvestre TaxID=2099400 RepID=A0A2S9H270_9BURK|nr:hypothetical protein S2091_1255 [Solimicrobium silvestre]
MIVHFRGDAPLSRLTVFPEKGQQHLMAGKIAWFDVNVNVKLNGDCAALSAGMIVHIRCVMQVEVF